MNDDDLDLELEIDEFEEDDVTPDEEWDDLEDDLEIENSDLAATDKKRSFLQKNFNFIVIGIAAIIGVFILFTQILSPNTPTPVQTSQAVVQDAKDKLGDMVDEFVPVTLDEEPEQPQALVLDESDDVLTPMTRSEDPLPALDLSPREESVDAQKEEVMLIDAVDTQTTQNDEPLFVFEPVEEDSDSLAALDQSLSVQEDSPISFEVQDVQENTNVENLSQVDIAAQNKADLQVLKDTEQAKYEQMERMMNDKLSEANAQIAALKQTILDLEQDVQEAKQAPKQVAKVEAKPVVSQASKKKVVKKKSSKKRARVKASDVWVLRSAQPGKAYVKDKKNGDIRVLNVGDKVRALGTIKSIKVENDLWVVRATLGTLSQ